MRKTRLGWVSLLLAGMLSACGGGSGGGTLYTISGTVTGLPTGAQLTVTDGSNTAGTISADGSFTLTETLAQNSSYSLAVTGAPAGEVCSVTNGSGTGVTADVTNVQITCSASTSSYTIGGKVSGLASGASVTLLDNASDSDTVSANGAFTFAKSVASGGAYAVTVGTQPSGQTCTVSNASGNGVNANVTNVSVVCASNATYTIGGTVSGLPGGEQVTLVDNGDTANGLTVTGNGAFSFPNAVSGAYLVTIGTQPTSATCSVSQGSGTATANVNNVSVSCSPVSYTIGGTVSGLSSGQTATIELNGDTANTVNLSSTSSSFTFPTAVNAGASYTVTVSTQPTAETCTVANGTGAASANVTNVTVSCATTTASTLTFSSGFQSLGSNGTGSTVEGGTFGAYGGSSLDGNTTYAPSSGIGAGTVSGNSLAPASTYMYYYYQFPATALPANAPTYEYMGTYIFAPGVTVLNGSGDTKGVQISGQNFLQFTMNENPEWANAPSNNFLIILTLGKYYNTGTTSKPAACNIQLMDVVQPTSAATAAASTTYNVPLSDFTVAQNCGQSISTAAQALALSQISKIDFQGDGGTSSTGLGPRGVNNLLSSSNLTVSTQTTGGSTPYQVPTTIALKGGITFTP